MGAVGEADGGRGAAHLLDGDDVLEVAQPRAAILLLDRDAVQAELAHLGPQLAREAVGLVDLGGDRRHLVGGETLDLLAQRVGGLAQTEIERRHCVGDHDLSCLSEGCRHFGSSTLTLMLISFHSPSDGMKSRSKLTRSGSVGK